MRPSSRVVALLLEVNALNIQDIDREIGQYVARCRYPEVKKWVKTVARNYLINLEGDELTAEYTDYGADKDTLGHFSAELPSEDTLPDWAKRSVAEKRPLHVFNSVQPRRRRFWKNLETIIDWFNSVADPKSPEFSRLNRMSFGQALEHAAAWEAKLQSKPFAYVRERNKVVVRRYATGYTWVMLDQEEHFKRESAILGHCVGNGTYFPKHKSGVGHYYSLRDEDNQPHVTIEAAKQGGVWNIVQIKGKENKKPIYKYQPYIVDLLEWLKMPLTGDVHNVDRDASRANAIVEETLLQGQQRRRP